MKYLSSASIAAISLAFATEALAVEWNVSVWGKRREFTEHIEKIAELVEERSNGDFTMAISYGGLSNERENLDGISIGAFEMAQFCAGYHPDKNRAITVLELPLMGVETLEQEVAVARAIYAHPAVQDEMAQWNARLMMTSPMPQYNLVGTGEPRATVESLDGLRVRASGGIGELLAAEGAVPTSVTATEAYNAMESGVVDAVSFAQHAHLSFRTIDVADWWTENLNPGTVNCPVVVNIDAYEALSDENKAILEGAVDDAIQHYLDQYALLLEDWDNVLEEKEIEKVRFSDEELARLAEEAQPIHEAWIAEMTAQGLPGQELYDLARSSLAEAKAAGK
ncbi:TRAP transporter substrate-binding protein DctP [Jannaschia rubra]|uniref:TRAP transporter solute receptor, DctP family n=1 Tax=Jannaschia rubra TaxID=282197 RepID=A0A0M6XQ99_9RHOB|nr:TRAP transporter substrate-binding protein DctP [Jannaschia rubra]CTQ32852.1 TRAP transporter solute receptor, DctP family [Jannaschia rubra]SFG29302.1 TRAP-type C4-dicarboxylate transport system, substrate-binding protein [Jannaschia rubra]